MDCRLLRSHLLHVKLPLELLEAKSFCRLNIVDLALLTHLDFDEPTDPIGLVNQPAVRLHSIHVKMGWNLEKLSLLLYKLSLRILKQHMSCVLLQLKV